MSIVLFETTLYINHSSGKTGSWSIKAEDNNDGTATLTTTALKVLGGNPVVTVEHVGEGKNIGRANETTPAQQAENEARSKAAKKMDKGYTETIPEAGQKKVNGLGLIMPMLAQPFKTLPEGEFYIQPKLDGHRCLASRTGDVVTLWSRGGKLINLPHIQKALLEVLPEGSVFDGELYCHGETLQTISSWVKRLQPHSEKLKYVVYDVVQNALFSERYTALYNWMTTNTAATVHLLETKKITHNGELVHYHKEYVSQGYEGTMVRTNDVGYEDGKRSMSLQKLKDFQDAEFEIVAVNRGTPKLTPTNTYQVAIYTCKCGDSTFDVTAPGDMHEKDAAWWNRDKAIGKMLTVKFFNYTPNGLPFLPVALQIREDL